MKWFLLVVFSYVSILSCNLAHAFPESIQKIDDKAKDLLEWNEDAKPYAQWGSDVGLVAAYIVPPMMILNEDHDKTEKMIGFLGAQGLNLLITNHVKVKTNRMRPNGENQRSFFSGHTSTAFTSAGVVCVIDKEQCGLAVGLAATTGYLRIATNKHWLSDVIVGAAAGFIVGRQVPIFVMQF